MSNYASARNRTNDPELASLYPERDAARAVVAKLRDLDPDGWSRWYDHVIPEDVGSFEQITEIVQARVDQLTARKHLQDHISSLPLSSLALLGDAYQQALRHLQTKPLTDTTREYPLEMGHTWQEQELLALNIVAAYVPAEPDEYQALENQAVMDWMDLGEAPTETRSQLLP